MDSLKQKILNEGEVYEGNILKVDGFLNHRIDIPFMREIAKEFHRLFKDDGVNKILTIEASGIAIVALVAEEFGCSLVFAKKTKTKILPAMCIPLRLRASLTALHTILLCQNDFSMKTIRSSLLMIFLQSAMRSTVLSHLLMTAVHHLQAAALLLKKVSNTAAINSGATVLRLNLLLLLKVWTMKQARFISEINRFFVLVIRCHHLIIN